MVLAAGRKGLETEGHLATDRAVPDLDNNPENWGLYFVSWVTPWTEAAYPEGAYLGVVASHRARRARRYARASCPGAWAPDNEGEERVCSSWAHRHRYKKRSSWSSSPRRRRVTRGHPVPAHRAQEPRRQGCLTVGTCNCYSYWIFGVLYVRLQLYRRRMLSYHARWPS